MHIFQPGNNCRTHTPLDTPFYRYSRMSKHFRISTAVMFFHGVALILPVLSIPGSRGRRLGVKPVQVCFIGLQVGKCTHHRGAPYIRTQSSCAHSLSRNCRFQLPASLRAVDSAAVTFHDSASRVGSRVYGHPGGLSVRERYILAEKREAYLNLAREACESAQLIFFAFKRLMGARGIERLTSRSQSM